MKSKHKRQQRGLLATMTNEPFQPVRLYYAISSDSEAVSKLSTLDCVVEAPHEACLQWLYHGETASLQFSAGSYDKIPKEKRPIVLGRIRFPNTHSMSLETNSIERAIHGAKFFSQKLGPRTTAIRCRVVNRCFAADEGSQEKLLAVLDQNVTVIDPRETEAALERALKNVKPGRDADRAFDEFFKQRVESRKDDVPMVEDFPLAPEEETPDFMHLTYALHFRLVRAVEHWNGNTHQTLAAIIQRTVEEGLSAHGQKGN